MGGHINFCSSIEMLKVNRKKKKDMEKRDFFDFEVREEREKEKEERGGRKRRKREGENEKEKGEIVLESRPGFRCCCRNEAKIFGTTNSRKK